MTKPNPLAWGQATDQILHALRIIGPSTARTIADEADLPYETVRRTMLRLSGATAATRRVHVLRWTYQGSDLEKPYLRAVYVLGPGRNADRPDPRPYNDVRRESAHIQHPCDSSARTAADTYSDTYKPDRFESLFRIQISSRHRP